MRVRKPGINADEFACSGNGWGVIGGRRVRARSHGAQFLEKVADWGLKQGAERGEPLRPDPNYATFEFCDLTGAYAEGRREMFLGEAALFAAKPYARSYDEVAGG